MDQVPSYEHARIIEILEGFAKSIATGPGHMPMSDTVYEAAAKLRQNMRSEDDYQRSRDAHRARMEHGDTSTVADHRCIHSTSCELECTYVGQADPTVPRDRVWSYLPPVPGSPLFCFDSEELVHEYNRTGRMSNGAYIMSHYPRDHPHVEGATFSDEAMYFVMEFFEAYQSVHVQNAALMEKYSSVIEAQKLLAYNLCYAAFGSGDKGGETSTTSTADVPNMADAVGGGEDEPKTGGYVHHAVKWTRKLAGAVVKGAASAISDMLKTLFGSLAGIVRFIYNNPLLTRILAGMAIFMDVVLCIYLNAADMTETMIDAFTDVLLTSLGHLIPLPLTLTKTLMGIVRDVAMGGMRLLSVTNLVRLVSSSATAFIPNIWCFVYKSTMGGDSCPGENVLRSLLNARAQQQTTASDYQRAAARLEQMGEAGIRQRMTDRTFAKGDMVREAQEGDNLLTEIMGILAGNFDLKTVVSNIVLMLASMYTIPMLMKATLVLSDRLKHFFKDTPLVSFIMHLEHAVGMITYMYNVFDAVRIVWTAIKFIYSDVINCYLFRSKPSTPLQHCCIVKVRDVFELAYNERERAKMAWDSALQKHKQLVPKVAKQMRREARMYQEQEGQKAWEDQQAQRQEIKQDWHKRVERGKEAAREQHQALLDRREEQRQTLAKMREDKTEQLHRDFERRGLDDVVPLLTEHNITDRSQIPATVDDLVALGITDHATQQKLLQARPEHDYTWDGSYDVYTGYALSEADTNQLKELAQEIKVPGAMQALASHKWKKNQVLNAGYKELVSSGIDPEMALAIRQSLNANPSLATPKAQQSDFHTGGTWGTNSNYMTNKQLQSMLSEANLPGAYRDLQYANAVPSDLKTLTVDQYKKMGMGEGLAREMHQRFYKQPLQ